MNSAVFCHPLIGLNPSLSFPLSHPSLRPVLPLYNKTGTRCIMREKKERGEGRGNNRAVVECTAHRQRNPFHLFELDIGSPFLKVLQSDDL